MKEFTKIGRLLYGLGIVALGVHQLLIKDFRSEILPPFPAWPHKYIVFPILTAVALIFSGVVISGLLKINPTMKKNTCLYLGLFFLALIVICHLPYILIFNFKKAFHLGAWIGVCEELAYAGGAFIIAGSYFESNFNKGKKNGFAL